MSRRGLLGLGALSTGHEERGATFIPGNVRSDVRNIDYTEEAEVNFFNMFGRDKVSVYRAVKAMKNQDGSYTVSLASRKGGGSTDEEMLLEVINLIYTLMEVNGHSWEEACKLIEDEVGKGKVIPWEIETDAMFRLFETYEELMKSVDNSTVGTRVTTPCRHNNCDGMYIVEYLIGMSRGDDLQRHKGVCTTCNTIRHGYKPDYEYKEERVEEDDTLDVLYEEDEGDYYEEGEAGEEAEAEYEEEQGDYEDEYEEGDY